MADFVWAHRKDPDGFNRQWSAHVKELKGYNRTRQRQEYVPSSERPGFDESKVEVIE
jgi:hypothetical protein